ncbi:urea transporter [Nitrospira sp. T9]|uniref:urea transporter n=1 Tax=unclassified Nitrospira TaxID=2652172 RepID=UPI003F943A76
MAAESIINDQPTLGDPGNFLRIVLRGVGQVMFQGHAGTGILFLVGIAFASPLMAVGAIIGAFIGPVVAALARFDGKEIENGLHGFNPVLVGIATVFYLKPEPLTWVLLIVGCVVATFLTFAMRRYLKFPTYTAPFILTTWLLLIIAHAMAGTAIDVMPAPAAHTPSGFVAEVLAGAAEVMFGATVVTGILFLAGIALCTWRHAVLGLLGSIVGTLVALYHNDPSSIVHMGIYGYNAVLAPIAVYLWGKSLLIAILAAMISVPLTEFFPSWLGIPALTAPFVVASWIIIAVGQIDVLFLREPVEKLS